jgi:cytochrome c-type biogenesis protein CcmH
VTPFILISAVMLVAAIVLLAVPLLRALRPIARGEPEAPKATVMMSVLIIGLPLVATALYAGISNFPWDDPQAAVAVPPGHGQSGNAGSMAEVTTQLEARLASNPEDREGWRMLGRTYLVTGQAPKAVEAYDKALQIKGDQDPGLELDLAEALVLTDDPAVQGRAKTIIDAALAADPMNQKALWYSGLMAARADDKATAKVRWTKLLETNPPDEIRQILVSQLQALGVEVPAMAGGGSPPAMGGGMGGPMGGGMGGSAPTDRDATVGRTIRVAVSVDPAVAGKLKPGVPLFVSARQPGIPGPPLAAVRLSTDQLPTTVVLSDANSMIEGRNLSSVDEVQLVARVAFGGTAVTTSGDLVGEAKHRKGASADVNVVINKVSP